MLSRWPTFLRHEPDLRSVAMRDECNGSVKKLLIGLCEGPTDLPARKINFSDLHIKLPQKDTHHFYCALAGAVIEVEGRTGGTNSQGSAVGGQVLVLLPGQAACS